MKKRVSVCVAFILVALFAAETRAQDTSKASPPTWVTETHNKCKVWNERPFEGAVNPNYALWWSGTCKNGYASGTGYLQWGIPDRNDPVNFPPLVFAQYDGPLVEGKITGHGKLSLSKGETYTGDFVDNEAEGFGQDTYSSGNWFEGKYSRGNRNGHGILHFQGGDKIECEWVDDRMKDGFIIWDSGTDGSHFEGYFVDGRASGHGFLTDKTGRHEGEWANGSLTIGDQIYTVQQVDKFPR